MLRNRKTGESSDIHASSFGLFNQPSFLDTIKNEIKKIPEILWPIIEEDLHKIDLLPISNIEKNKIAANLIKFCEENSQLINEFINQPELLAEIVAKIEKELLAEIEKSCSNVSLSNENHSSKLPEFGSFLLETLTKAALNHYTPIAGLIAAAAGAGIEVKDGIPDGGMDLCGDANPYCSQGYLTNGTSNILSQFARVIITSYSYGKNGGGNIPFLACLSNDKVGNKVAELFKNNTMGTATQECLANSVTYLGSTATVRATNLPGSCEQLQNAFNPLFQECMNESTKIGLIVGGAIGGAAVVVGLAITIGFLYHNNKCNPCCKR